MPENCLIFKKCCKKIKKKSLQNTSINKNGSNESSKMRYGKAIRGNRQRVGRTTNKCFFKKDEVFKKEEPVPPPPPPTVQIDGGGPGGVGMGDWTNQNPIIFTKGAYA